MTKSFRAIHQWNHWLSHNVGEALLKSENEFLIRLLSRQTFDHALIIGVPQQTNLLNDCEIQLKLMATSLPHAATVGYNRIETTWDELPFASGSIDCVILPHVLEHIDNPHQVLAEACRIVKPEGSIIVMNFNPLSLWGLQRFINRRKGHHINDSLGHFIAPKKIKQWLALSDFQLIKQKTFFFRPPLQHQSLFRGLAFLEWIGNKCFLPLGGVYVLMAKAKVIPLTPIRLHWKQQVGDAKVGLMGPSAWNSR